jgi:hypothetical protein
VVRELNTKSLKKLSELLSRWSSLPAERKIDLLTKVQLATLGVGLLLVVGILSGC